MQALDYPQRREERKEADGLILFRLSGETSFRQAKIKNISHHGLFMLAHELLQLGEQAEVIISPYDSEHNPMQVTVEIVHIQPADETIENGYGCKVTSSNIIENIDL